MKPMLFNDLIQLLVLIVTVVIWIKNNKNEKIKTNAQMNIEVDRQLKDAMKRLANEEGDIQDIFELNINDLHKDYLKEDVYDVISTLNSICYFYKKTNRDITKSNDFWVQRFHFFATKKLFLSAFDKYDIKYEPTMYKLFKRRNKHLMDAKNKAFYEEKIKLSY